MVEKYKNVDIETTNRYNNSSCFGLEQLSRNQFKWTSAQGQEEVSTHIRLTIAGDIRKKLKLSTGNLSK